eukprot:8643890-Karenia_brevis.AAC.1
MARTLSQLKSSLCLQWLEPAAALFGRCVSRLGEARNFYSCQRCALSLLHFFLAATLLMVCNASAPDPARMGD